MTPLQMIKEGVIKHDFNLVAQAYTALTGEVLEVPSEAMIVEQIKQIPHPQRSGYDVDEFTFQIVDKTKQPRGEKNLTRTEPIDLKKVKAVGNLFNDALEIATDDIAFDKKVHIKVPVQRNRESPQFKKFACEECGKEAILSPVHAPTGRYVCPKCTKEKMRGR